MSDEGGSVTQTAGGLIKRSTQFTRAQFAWLQERAARKGQASLASVLRELIDDAMKAERADEDEAA